MEPDTRTFAHFLFMSALHTSLVKRDAVICDFVFLTTATTGELFYFSFLLQGTISIDFFRICPHRPDRGRVIFSFNGNNVVLSREREELFTMSTSRAALWEFTRGFCDQNSGTRSEADSNSAEPVKSSTKISSNWLSSFGKFIDVRVDRFVICWLWKWKNDF